MTKRFRRALDRLVTAWAVLFGLVAGGAAHAETSLDPVAVETFVDQIVEPAMQTTGIPGAMIAIVDRDTVILAKGYGVAERADETPVSPDRTLFNVASVGKTFTAIIATQLVEEGLIDPDADVNTYLPDARRVTGGVVTLRMLLGHQAGFDKDLSFQFAGPGEVTRINDGEINRRLRLLVPPGGVSSYDNVGFGLIGLVAEAVTGISLPDLYRERIFEPIGMRGAAYGIPGEDAGDYAHCYVPLGPDNVHPCVTVQFRESIWGAGGVFLSANAAARYMRMILNGGELDGARILTPSAFADLTDLDAYRFHPGLPGLARAFQEIFDPERQVYGHTGSIPGFSTVMHLYPDAGVGILITFMGGQPGSYQGTLSRVRSHLSEQAYSPEILASLQALHGLPQAFGTAFVPASEGGNDPRASITQSGPVAADAPSALAGRYFASGPDSRNLIVRIMRWSRAFDVRTLSANEITVAGQGPYRWLAPFLYQNEAGHRLAFATHDDGHMYMAAGVSIATLVRLSWWQAPFWAPAVYAGALIVLLSGLIHLWPGLQSPARKPLAMATGAVLLIIAASALELEYGIWFKIVQGNKFLPLLWSTMFVAGGALALALPWVALRRCIGEIRSVGGVQKLVLIAMVHAIVLAVAAIAFVFASVALL